jgi:hypothetical protein
MWHTVCLLGCVVGSQRPGRVRKPKAFRTTRSITNLPKRSLMKWTKPEAEVVAVTMEVTAYVATL